MTRRVGMYFLFAVAVVLAGVQVSAAECEIVGQLRTQWENTKNLVVRLAEAFPEDKYDYKPTPEVRSFREQLLHLIGENYMFMGMVAGEKPGESQNLKTRAEILKALSESYDYGTKVLAGLTDQKAMEITAGFRGQQVPRWTIVIGNMNDNMDHYGNLVVYLRLNGIVPPRSAPRQQQPQR